MVSEIQECSMTYRQSKTYIQDVIEHVCNSGVLVRFLPSYSPDLNPVEEVFAKVKHYLRRNDLVLQTTMDPNPLIYNAFAHGM